MLNEQMSGRLEARLNFLEKEQKQLRSYNSDLVYFLLVSKKVLKEVLSMKSSARLDHSADTDQSSTVPFKIFEAEFSKTQQLFSDLQSVRRLRDLTQGKLLISKQLSQETRRKETQMEQECEGRRSEMQKLLEKKDERGIKIQDEINKFQGQLDSLKNDKVTVLSLDPKNLAYHKHMNKLKIEIAKASKQLQLCVMQTEELEKYSCGLMDSIDKYKLLAKNPGLKFRRSAHLSHQESDESESSVECVFPDKFQVGSLSKPELPRLDFSKLPKKPPTEKPIQNVQAIKSLIQEAENLCRDKTEAIQKTRELVVELENKNLHFVKALEGTQYGIKTERRHVEKQKVKKKRSLSNGIDYIYREVAPQKNHEEQKQSCDEGVSNESSFSSVIIKDEYDDEESDIVFYECIKNIQH